MLKYIFVGFLFGSLGIETYALNKAKKDLQVAEFTKGEAIIREMNCQETLADLKAPKLESQHPISKEHPLPIRSNRLPDPK